MRTIKVTVNIGLIGCRRETTIEVEDDATEEEIEAAASDAAHELIDWSWEEKS